MTDKKVRLHETTDSPSYYYIKNQLVKLKKRHEQRAKTVSNQYAEITRLRNNVTDLRHALDQLQEKLSAYRK